MYLLSLYSEPDGLFPPVEFKKGINIIYGKKDTLNPKDSLNSIGKSTFLDLLDFCLLGSHLRAHNPRLFAAKEILEGYKIVLEFEVKNKAYKIKRSFDDPLEIEFIENNISIMYHYDDLKKELGNLIFKRDNYTGIFYDNWFRTLIVFYLKIQKFQRDRFLDPIKYIKDASETELNQYVLYLMGIDNQLSHDNYKVSTELKRLQPAVNEIKDLLLQKYDLRDLSEMTSEISKLKLETRRLEEAINTFKLGEQYVNAEVTVNKLTGEIKELIYSNFLDKKKIDSYNESIDIKESINTNRIKKLYQELNTEFAILVKKTLDQAIKFRKELSESRRKFLESEILKLNKDIENRNETIQTLEDERSNIFYFLAAKEAISDLTEAFYNLSEKRNKLIELETNSDNLVDLSSKKAELEEELKRIEKEVIIFLNEIRSEIDKFYEVFQTVFDSIYKGKDTKSNFTIFYNPKKKSIIDIDVTLPDMFGKGKNQGRTLLFDISVLLNSFKFSDTFPRFLVHDGIFDGMDKAHFIKIYEFIERLKTGKNSIQYITTINEEGTLSQKFGNADIVKPEIIESEAILTLSPSNKLFKKDFDNRIFNDLKFH